MSKAGSNRWHINDVQKVMPCDAAPGTCRFGKGSEEPRHFASEAEGELFLAKKDSSFSPIGTRRRKAAKPVVNVEKASVGTKTAVNKLVEKGFSVGTARSLEEVGVSSSQIDILDEDLRGISLDTVKKNLPF